MFYKISIIDERKINVNPVVTTNLIDVNGR